VQRPRPARGKLCLQISSRAGGILARRTTRLLLGAMALEESSITPMTDGTSGSQALVERLPELGRFLDLRREAEEACSFGSCDFAPLANAVGHQFVSTNAIAKLPLPNCGRALTLPG